VSIAITAKGTAQAKTTGTTLTLANVTLAEGASLIVSAGYYGSLQYITDIKWGAVDLAQAAYHSTLNGGVYSEIWLLHAVTAGTHDIVITWDSNLTARSMTAEQVTGLTATPEDTAAWAGVDDGGPSTAPDSGAGAETLAPSSLLYGSVLTSGPVEDTAGSWGGSFTASQRDGTTGSVATSNVVISTGYRITSAVGTYAAAKSGCTSRYWTAAIIVLRGPTETVVDPAEMQAQAVTQTQQTITNAADVQADVTTQPQETVANAADVQCEAVTQPQETITEPAEAQLHVAPEILSRPIPDTDPPTAVTAYSVLLRAATPAVLGDENSSTGLYSATSTANPAVFSTPKVDTIEQSADLGPIEGIVISMMGGFLAPDYLANEAPLSTQIRYTTTTGTATKNAYPFAAWKYYEDGDAVYTGGTISTDPGGTVIPSEFLITTRPDGQPWTWADINALVDITPLVSINNPYHRGIANWLSCVWIEVYGPLGAVGPGVKLTGRLKIGNVFAEEGMGIGDEPRVIGALRAKLRTSGTIRAKLSRGGG